MIDQSPILKKGFPMRYLFLVLALMVSSCGYAASVRCSDGKVYQKKIRNTRGLYCGSYGPYKYGGKSFCNLDMRQCRRM
jgi:hypothetical protein